MTDSKPHTPGGIGAEELMVGNWVTYNPKSVDEGTIIEPLQIAFIDNRDEPLFALEEPFDNYYSPDELLPIPLTEDWLKKFGWSENGREIDKLRKLFDLDSSKYAFTLMQEDNGYWLIDNHGPRGFNICHVEIKYVHQLQNLYFALTQTHLTHVNQQH